MGAKPWSHLNAAGLTLMAKCRARGISYRTVMSRMREGWTLTRALSEPVKKKKVNR